MAQVSGTFSAHSAIGNREDLTDIIYDVSPTETPFMSNAGRVEADAVSHEWQTDVLAAAAANRAIEGDDATANTATATVRVKNWCQISRKMVIVSGTQDAVNKAGRGEELSYQIVKRGRELKREMEFALTRNQASSAGGNATARSSASLESWISGNKTHIGAGTDGTTPGYSAATGLVTAPTDESATATFTEAHLKQIILEAWSDGGDPRLIMCGPVNKQKISAFSGIATQYKDNPGVGQAVIVGAADVYVSDFGNHQVVPNRFQRERTVFVLDMEFWAVAYLRPMQVHPIAKTGDAEKRQILVEYTLCSYNQLASGKIAECNTS